MSQDFPLPILALWAVPRSTSTAFAKAISGAPGIKVLHEPFTDCYYFGPQRRSRRYGDSPVVADFDPAAAQDLILSAAAGTDRIFVKELAFQAYHYLQDDLLHRVSSTVLIRHPLRVMASLLHLKPDFSEEEYGFQALDTLVQRITGLQGGPPAIIEGEQFRTNPRETLRLFCSANHLPYSDAMLNWSSGSLRLWLPHESESQQKWHTTLERSQTILPPSPSLPELELSGQQQAMLERAMEIYERLAALALRQAPHPWIEPAAVQAQGPVEDPHR